MEIEPRRKIPCQVSMTARQVRIVEGEAHRQGITMAEVIRRIVDNYIDQQRLDRIDLRA